MALCEMCGKNNNLMLAEIEGVELKVCSVCAKHGKVRAGSVHSDYRSGYSRRFPPPKEEPEERVISTFAQLLRGIRERSRLNLEDFAQFLNEKESIVSKWEGGSVSPNLEEAKRLQKLLGVGLIVKEEMGGELKQEKHKPGEDTFTLGDFIKIKKRS